jgi:putative oxidoreductase
MTTQLESRLAHHSDLAPTALRVALGAVFLAHAYAKAFLFTFPGTMAFFASHGFPGWTAYPVFAAELFGGLALIAGFQVRAIALALLPVMLGAIIPHASHGWMFTNQGGGWEYVAFINVALIAQALLGSGAYAIDRALEAGHAPTPVMSATT